MMVNVSAATTNLVEVYTKLKTVYPQIITDDNLKAEMVTFYASVRFVNFKFKLYQNRTHYVFLMI